MIGKQVKTDSIFYEFFSSREAWLQQNSSEMDGLKTASFPSQQRSGHQIEVLI